VIAPTGKGSAAAVDLIHARQRPAIAKSRHPGLRKGQKVQTERAHRYIWHGSFSLLPCGQTIRRAEDRAALAPSQINQRMALLTMDGKCSARLSRLSTRRGEVTSRIELNGVSWAVAPRFKARISWRDIDLYQGRRASIIYWLYWAGAPLRRRGGTPANEFGGVSGRADDSS
jgi:hypothetical protein